MRRRRADAPGIPGWDQGKYDRAASRVARLSGFELFNWVEAAGSGMARAFSDHRKDGSVESLEEIGPALITMWAVYQELLDRAKAELDPARYRV